MLTSRRFPITDEGHVGEARRKLAELSRDRDLPETDAGRFAIIVTELGNNLTRHAQGGEIVVREIPGSSSIALELLSIDRGPGITNLREALRDGFSTGGTAGTGLGAVKRLADRFDIFSQPGRGTVVRAVVGVTRAEDPFEVGGISIPVKGETVCGDGWGTAISSSAARLVVADGLGHGPLAGEASREALVIFSAHPTLPPAPTLDLMHLALGKTRGAAGAIVEIDLPRRTLTSAGIGNVAMRLLSPEGAKSLISHNGTLGGNARPARDATVPWTADTLLVMHSDGLGTHWNPGDYPGVTARHPSILAALLYRDHRRERDDVTVVVLREKP